MKKRITNHSRRSRTHRRSRSLSARLCRCIKSVRRRVRSEKRAIPICIASVLQTKQKTLHSFRCKKKPFLKTQRLLPSTSRH